MPLLGFTKLKDKLLDGSKTQTIRKPRKHPFKVGDKLYIYWKLRTKQCEKLGEAVVTKIVRKKLEDINEEDAVKDGFERKQLPTIPVTFSAKTMFLDAFFNLHPKIRADTELDIITFKWLTRKRHRGFAPKNPRNPNWTKQSYENHTVNIE